MGTVLQCKDCPAPARAAPGPGYPSRPRGLTPAAHGPRPVAAWPAPPLGKLPPRAG